MQKWALLGASRGFGKAFLEHILLRDAEASVLAVSRTSVEQPNVEHFPFDLASENKSALIDKLKQFAPTRLIYFAGGGPYGTFADKQWKDHLWALRVTYLTPAEILHTALQQNWPLQQIVFIGSAVAEGNPDPNASSYAAAKHALRGLVQTTQKELINHKLDLRLFSPGYMDTQMLPANAWPRYQENLVKSPALQASLLFDWLHDPQMVNAHLVST